MLGCLWKSHLQLVSRGGPAWLRGVQHTSSASKLRELLEFLIFSPSFFFFSFFLFFFFLLVLVSPSHAVMQELLLPWLQSQLSARASGGCRALRAACHTDPHTGGCAACQCPQLAYSPATHVEASFLILHGLELHRVLLQQGTKHASCGAGRRANL